MMRVQRPDSENSKRIDEVDVLDPDWWSSIHHGPWPIGRCDIIKCIALNWNDLVWLNFQRQIESIAFEDFLQIKINSICSPKFTYMLFRINDSKTIKFRMAFALNVLFGLLRWSFIEDKCVRLESQRSTMIYFMWIVSVKQRNMWRGQTLNIEVIACDFCFECLIFRNFDLLAPNAAFSSSYLRALMWGGPSKHWNNWSDEKYLQSRIYELHILSLVL